MRKFFAETIDEQQKIAALPAAASAHIVRVLRMKSGDELLLLDGKGSAWRAVLTTVTVEECCAQLVESVPLESEPRLRVTLYQGLPKGDKLDDIVRGCTEVGVQAVVPFVSERTVVRPDEKSAKRRVQRCQTIALSAAEQSGRGIIPQIGMPLSFASLVDACSRHECVLLAWEEEKACSLREAAQRLGAVRDVALVIGPEGGITPKEAEKLRAAGAVCVTLGPRILRTETAGTAALAALLCVCGDMEGVS